MNLLEVNHLSVRYGTLEILQDICFSVDEGKWLMIVGPNGAGKSTIVQAISQGIRYAGQISWRGQELQRMKSYELARHIGVLSQTHAVYYSFSVEEIVRLGRYAYAPGIFSHKNGSEKELVSRALEQTGLTELRNQSVLNLSGGELQRVFLAQLFVQDPELLILDEPTNHLDMVYQKQIFTLLSAWLHTPGRAVISVVHDLSLAMAYGTEALLLDQGKMAAYGQVRNVLSSANLERVYKMDVYEWMGTMLRQWESNREK